MQDSGASDELDLPPSEAPAPYLKRRFLALDGDEVEMDKRIGIKRKRRPGIFKGRIEIESAETFKAAKKVLLECCGQAEILDFHEFDTTSELPSPSELHELLDAIEFTDVRIPWLSIHADFIVPYHENKRLMTRFFKVLGRIPSLTTLWWSQTRKNMRLKGLARIVSAARRLKKLKCDGSIFVGQTHDFERFAAAIREHPTLEVLSFAECSLASSNQTFNCIYPILASIPTIPNLSSLSLSCWLPSRRAIQMSTGANSLALLSAVSRACSHPRLTWLSIDNSKCHSVCLLAVQTALGEAGCGVRTLALENDLQHDDCDFLSGLLSCNKSLQSLSVLMDGSNSGLVDRKMLQIFGAIQDNSTLQSLTFHGCKDYIPGAAVQLTILSMLQQRNRSLTEIDFNPYDDHEKTKEWAFLAEMEVYLMWNKRGWTTQLEDPNMCSKTVMGLIQSASSSVGSLYFLMSKNPTLIPIHNGRKRR